MSSSCVAKHRFASVFNVHRNFVLVTVVSPLFGLRPLLDFSRGQVPGFIGRHVRNYHLSRMFCELQLSASKNHVYF